MKLLSKLTLPLVLSSFLFQCAPQNTTEKRNNTEPEKKPITEVNEDELSEGKNLVAIKNVRLINGTGSGALENAMVVIKGNEISEIGPVNEIDIPSDVEVIDGSRMSMLPGFIDAHFHLDGNDDFPALFLQHGITSVRDPGAWIESYDKVRKSGEMLPRLFLTGPHFDMPPAAYPKNSIIVRDEEETRNAVQTFYEQGASAIKVYFRLPLKSIRALCEEATRLGIPTTAHLEIVNAMDAINAGLNGIEHITSFGTALLPMYEAEKYRQGMLADNNFRRAGRYQVWNQIDFTSQLTDQLLEFLVEKQTFVCPTLGAFEYRLSDSKTDSIRAGGFKKMMEFTGMVDAAGAQIVVGSHSWVPYAEVGWSYQHEMILLKECGMSNMDIIKSATIDNARFFRIEDRLGSIEVGKQADFQLIEGNPLEDLESIFKINKVMLNGEWVPRGVSDDKK
ncbi:MAG: amidohydrolase family protein [Cyclobacteriaceae bacterium]